MVESVTFFHVGNTGNNHHLTQLREEDRIVIQKQLLPRMVELSKNPYARFIMSKLIVTAPKSQLPGMVVDVCMVLAADVTKLRYLPDHGSRGICLWFC